MQHKTASPDIAQIHDRKATPQPPLYKQTIISFIGIYPLIMAFMALFGPVIQPLPLWLNNLIVCLMLVPLLTFGVIPLLNRLFARWLHA